MATGNTFINPTPEKLRDLLNDSWGDIDRPVLTYTGGEGNFTIAFRNTTLDTDRVPVRNTGGTPVVVSYASWVFSGSSNHEGVDSYLRENFDTLLRTSPQHIREEPPYADAWQGNGPGTNPN